MKLSVVIPTFNRIDSLQITLKKLEKQSFNDFEVVVVDDGSTDLTQEILNNFKTKKFQLKILKQENKKQGIARNFGVSKANSNLIVFIQDDIWPDKNFLREHFKFHNENIGENFVLIGKTVWTESLQKNDFYKFLDGSGNSIFPAPLFDYNSLQDLKETNFQHFYTNNLSIKKSFFESEKFNEKFNSYGWEDMELGFRLFKKGMKIYFNSKALAKHNHNYILEQFQDRERQVAKSLNKLFQIQPKIKKYFKINLFKKLIFKFFSLKIFLLIFKFLNRNAYWYFLGKREWVKKYFKYKKI